MKKRTEKDRIITVTNPRTGAKVTIDREKRRIIKNRPKK